MNKQFTLIKNQLLRFLWHRILFAVSRDFFASSVKGRKEVRKRAHADSPGRFTVPFCSSFCPVTKGKLARNYYFMVGFTKQENLVAVHKLFSLDLLKLK